MDNGKRNTMKSGKSVESSESKINKEASNAEINIIANEEFNGNPSIRLLNDRQRHVLLGIIGTCIVCLMSFGLIELVNKLKQ